MDKYQYLDNLLFYLTSEKRRGNLFLKFIDKREKNSSGYNFVNLLSHFLKTIYSSEIGARRISMILFTPILVSSIIIGISLFIISQYKNIYISPGFSLFVIQFLFYYAWIVLYFFCKNVFYYCFKIFIINTISHY